jgi:3-methyladenine DNA glycosylase AlkD
MSEMTLTALKREFKKLARPGALEGMARYGINTATAYGVAVPELRKLARQIGKDRAFAATLWASGIHDARLLASMIDIPAEVTNKQMEAWVKDFNSWDLCDQTCLNLFSRHPLGWKKAVSWASRKGEYVKRAAFALQACLALHEKTAPDERFLEFFPIIEREATDPRNYVKKAVNWSLRQIGKRSEALRKHALKTCKTLLALEDKTASWIARDAIRELESEAVINRLRK